MVQEPPTPWTAHDPRASSTHCLLLSQSASLDGDRRKLLLVYIHGFMGDETSFQSFPAHVHNYLSTRITSTHVVHTKIYPRYRSKQRIQHATNDFSTWLTPLESPTTDIVLLGHSLGGILAAEVALLSSRHSTGAPCLRHSLLGIIGFDTPFLGMHYGVIKAGLGSIFHSTAPPTASNRDDDNQPSGTNTQSPLSDIANMLLKSPPSSDPNYDPPLPNDVRLSVRSGWSNAFHFISKHSSNLRLATKQLITSHLEFGGCLADYDGLKERYRQIRMLEEPDERNRKIALQGPIPPPRVRFVNYYTASTGRLRKDVEGPASTAMQDMNETIDTKGVEADQSDLSFISSPGIDMPDMRDDKSDPSPPILSPSISVTDEKHDDDDDDSSDDQSTASESTVNASSPSSMTTLVPLPVEGSDDDDDEFFNASDLLITPDDSVLTPSRSTVTSALKPPELPGPPALDGVDHAANKLILKSYLRSLKDYRHALKLYRKAECSRLKHERKLMKDLARQSIKTKKEARKAKGKLSADEEQIHELAEEEEARKMEMKERELEQSERKVERHQEKQERKAERAGHKLEAKLVKTEMKKLKNDKRTENKIDKARFRKDKEIEKMVVKGKRPPPPLPPRGAVSGANVSSTLPLSSTTSGPSTYSSTTEEAPKKDRKFCILPPKDPAGNRDPCWPRIFMEGVDEVGAHCGLFFPSQPWERGEGCVQGDREIWSQRYVGFVSDVGERVKEWLAEAAEEASLHQHDVV